MINNRVGCFPQATVNTLLDESYLVVKSVYLKLKEIVDVSEHLETITTLAEHLEEIENVQTAANRVNRVWESIDNIDRLTESAANIDTVAGISNEVKQVVKNLDSIKGAKKNAEDAQKAVTTCTQIKEYLTQKEIELNRLAGTYYVPHVSKEGVLSWTNTGGRDNPNPVNIKGDPGTSIVLTGQVANYKDLIQKYPTGSLGDVYQAKDTQDVWVWDTKQKKWVNVGALKGAKGDTGASANEILMNPDPELYFLSIYGYSSGDVIGDIVVQESAFESDPTDVLNTILKE